jgi:hypothetical protein
VKVNGIVLAPERPRGKKDKRKIKEKPLTVSMEKRIAQQVEKAQFENPICRITILPGRDASKDFCRYLDKEDEPRESLFARFAKQALREKINRILQRELFKRSVLN